MKEIILEKIEKGTISFDEVNECNPIFAKKDGVLCGMVVDEARDGRSEKWILRVGGSSGATGYHATLRKCLNSCLIHRYKFYTI